MPDSGPRLFGARQAVLLLAGTGAIFLAFGYWNVRLQRREHERVMVRSADRLAEVIQRSTRYLMLHNDRAALDQVVRDIGRDPGIVHVRVHNLKTAPPPSAWGAERATWSTDAGGRRELTLMRPVANEPSCAQAACHAHPSSEKVLGVIETRMELGPVDEQLARHEGLLRALTLGGAALAGGLALFLVWTAVRRLERNVEKKTGELERANRVLFGSEKMAAIGKLAATVAHEVNNPLFGILTYSRLAQKELARPEIDGPARERMTAQLGVIERESRRCGDIMKNLLTFARQAPRRRQPENLNELVQRSLALVRHQAELSGIRVETHLDPGLPAVSCDAGQIQQVILAVLVNACEVMKAGGALSVASERRGASAVLRIADTGPGIPLEVLPQIFEPFFSTKDDPHRTGLGLAVARSIVEQHGGEIEARSTEGRGAEFAISIPLETNEREPVLERTECITTATAES
jgi:two-component system NtrC family sensor kinase